MSKLTGIKDLDRYLLLIMDDETLFNILLTNRDINKLQNEDFWRDRTQRYFPYLIQYKNEDVSWKNFYLSNVFFLDKLGQYGFEYTEGDPKFYYYIIISDDTEVDFPQFIKRQMYLINTNHDDLALFFLNRLRTGYYKNGVRTPRLPLTLESREWKNYKKQLIEHPPFLA